MLILEYGMTLVPGVILAGILVWSLRGRHPLWHLGVFIAFFIFTRDAMTPLGLWTIGARGGLWMRFYPEPLVLMALGLSSVGLVVVMQRLSPELAGRVVWFQNRRWLGILVGILTAMVVALPLLVYQGVRIPLEERGGPVAIQLLPFILIVTLGGNLLEEVLFRGYLYGWLTQDEQMGPVAATLLSGVFFAFGHLFLAFTVTSVGIGVILFTLWEGCIAGLVRAHFGVFPAVLTHGLAVFLLTIGGF